MQQGMDAFRALGIDLPSPAYIVGAIVFGVIGLAAYYYGKRNDKKRTRWLGVALMLYPYVVWQTWLMYAVGTGLCVAIWFDRS